MTPAKKAPARSADDHAAATGDPSDSAQTAEAVPDAGIGWATGAEVDASGPPLTNSADLLADGGDPTHASGEYSGDVSEPLDADHEAPAAARADASRRSPAVIDGPFGTTVDSADPLLPTLRVEVNSNVMLGNVLRTVGQKVAVPDDAESRGAISVGHLRLLEDHEALDGEAESAPSLETTTDYGEPPF